MAILTDEVSFLEEAIELHTVGWDRLAAGQAFFPDPDNFPGDVITQCDYVYLRLLVDAYWRGIFPWPQNPESGHIEWCSPDPRGVIFMDEFCVPKSFQRAMKKLPYRVTTNLDFDRVIEWCAFVERPGQNGTWITEDLIKSYKDLHRAGVARSFEVWDEFGQLIGGLYGVWLGNIFCGESMFHREPGASKFALVKAVEFLRSHGVVLIDTQMVTPTTALFGAREIPRREYLALLRKYRGKPPMVL